MTGVILPLFFEGNFPYFSPWWPSCSEYAHPSVMCNFQTTGVNLAYQQDSKAIFLFFTMVAILFRFCAGFAPPMNCSLKQMTQLKENLNKNLEKSVPLLLNLWALEMRKYNLLL